TDFIKYFLSLYLAGRSQKINQAEKKSRHDKICHTGIQGTPFFADDSDCEKKSPGFHRGSGYSWSRLSDSYYVCGLKPFRTLGHFKRDTITFSKGFEAVARDGREMAKYIFTTFLLQKTKTLAVVKPFYCSVYHCVLSPDPAVHFYLIYFRRSFSRRYYEHEVNQQISEGSRQRYCLGVSSLLISGASSTHRRSTGRTARMVLHDVEALCRAHLQVFLDKLHRWGKVSTRS